MKKMAFKILSVVMALTLMLGVCAPAILAATEETEGKKEINYVSIGDSMANGYCFEGYKQTSNDRNKYDFLTGKGMYGVDAYPLQFEEYLEGKGYTVNHTKLATSAMLTEDFLYLLGGREYFDDGWGGYRDYIGTYTDEEIIPYIRNAVIEADIITLGLGNASFGAYLLNQVTSALGVMGGSLDEEDRVTLEDALAIVEDEELKATVLEAYDMLIEKIEPYYDTLPETWETQAAVDIIIYTVASFLVNYEKVIDKILELNPDVEIILVGLMNTTYGMTVTGEGFDDVPVGDIMDDMFGILNAYIAGVPAAKQLTGEYSWISEEQVEDLETTLNSYYYNIQTGETKEELDLDEVIMNDLGLSNEWKKIVAEKPPVFYYAAQPQPLFISQAFDALQKAEWGNIDCGNADCELCAEGKACPDGRLSGKTVRDRTLDAYSGRYAISGMLEQAFGLPTDAFYITLADVEAYEADPKWNSEYASWGALNGDLAAFDELNTMLNLGINVPGNLFTGSAQDFKRLSVAIYLALEEAIAQSVGTTAVPLDGLMTIAGDLSSVFEDVDVSVLYQTQSRIEGLIGPIVEYLTVMGRAQAGDPTVTEQVIADAEKAIREAAPSINAGMEELRNDVAATTIQQTFTDFFCGEDILPLVKVFALFKAGNGMSVHPTPTGHDNIAKAVIDSYENGYTVQKEMLNKIYGVIIEYYDEAYEYAYAEAVKRGYVDEINKYLDDAEWALDEAEKFVLANAEYSRTEELVPKCVAAIADARVTIAELRELINEADKLDAESYENLIALLGALENNMYDVAEITAIIAADAAEYLIAEAEKQLAILNAQLEVAVGEAKVWLEAEIARIEAQLKADLEALKAQANKQVEILKDAIDNAIEDAKETAKEIAKDAVEYLKDAAGEALDMAAKYISYLFVEYGHDVAVWVYYWLYNNPETVIGFFNEYGDEMVDFIVDNHEIIVGVIGYIVYNYGEDIACYVIENADVIFPAIAKWFDIHGVYAWDLIKVYLEALGVDIISADELIEMVGDLALVVKELGMEALEKVLQREFANLEEAVKYVIAVKDEVIAQIEVLVENATNHYYIRNAESLYASIGGEGYADLVADALNVGFADLGGGLRASDIIALLDSTYENDAYGNALLADKAGFAVNFAEAIKKADIITLDLGEADLVDFTVNQVTGMLLDTYGNIIKDLVDLGVLASAPVAETYEMDWTRFADFITAEDVENVKDAVEKVLVEAGLPVEYTYNVEINQQIGDSTLTVTYPVDLYPVEMATYAVECYLYATANYVYNYSAAIEAIHAVNPDAQVLVIGAVNPFADLDLVVEGVNVAEILAQFATAMDAQALACAITLPNTTFVSVKDAETALDVYSVIDFENLKVNTGAFGATEAGNAYIAEQVLAALTLDCTHTYDNACDAICNICQAERTVADHVYDNKCDTDCNVCGATREVGAHTFGEWVVVTEPTTEAEGLKERVCTECGYKETATIAKLENGGAPVDPPVTEPDPDDSYTDNGKPDDTGVEEPKGLPAAAIVAIVIGSTLVVGVGGFAIFWFVIKKKSFADLAAIFKK